jgi:hypothetical protein
MSTKGKKRARLSKGVSFDPSLHIHRFDLQSPTKFRLQNKVEFEATDLDDETLRLELSVAQQDGKIGSAPTPTKRAPMAKKVDQLWRKDLRSDLEEMGFSAPKAKRSELANRTRLATAVVKLAELGFSDVTVGLKMMSQKQLVKELETRRIKHQGHRRAQMLQDLAAAMIKDTADAVIGDGYEFGRRFITIEDCIDPMSDKEMRDCLKQRFQLPSAPRKKEDKRDLLTKMMLGWLKNQNNECQIGVLQEQLHSRGLRDRASSTDKDTLFNHLFSEVEKEAEDNDLAFDLRVESDDSGSEEEDEVSEAKQLGSPSTERKDSKGSGGGTKGQLGSPRKKRKAEHLSPSHPRIEAPVGILKSTQQQDGSYCTMC